MLERRILISATVFVLALAGIIALSVRTFGVDLPTCLTDVRPFKEARVLVHEPKRLEIHYVAKMWKFEPAHVDVLPGSTVDIYLSTADVTHGMQIVGTNVNLMAVPGAVNYARVRFDKPGDYLVVCNEYCGISHHNMAGRIRVAPDAVTQPLPPPEPPAQSRGAAILEEYACTACHSLDGSPSEGPTFKGLYGSTRVMTDGTSVVADDAYITESIVKPEARMLKDFPGEMPPVELTPEELKAVLEYLRTLR
ncbi:MAG TPA: c-type cytochrome [Thermoanaerobaculia bacterium]|nr:c-type cytochrome [Thermoanaerobaculia bacterium]